MSHCHGGMADNHYQHADGRQGFSAHRIFSSPYQHYNPLTTTSTPAHRPFSIGATVCIAISFMLLFGGIVMLLNGAVTAQSSSAKISLFVIGAIFITFSTIALVFSSRRLCQISSASFRLASQMTQASTHVSPVLTSYPTSGCCTTDGYQPPYVQGSQGRSCCGGGGHSTQPSAPPMGEEPATAATAPPAYADAVGKYN